MNKKFKTGDCITQECCECSLRHIWIFKVIRGKTPQDDEVEMEIYLADTRSTSDKVNAER